MKNYLPITLLFTFSSLLLTSCEAIKGIFNAGVWVGVLAVTFVIALVVWIIAKVSGGKK